MWMEGIEVTGKNVITVISTNHKFFCNFRFIAVQVQVTS